MADVKGKTRGLGRGLSALMADVHNDPTTPDTPARADSVLPIEKVQPNPDQPRRQFDEDNLTDLTNSIREKGILQPLIVRPLDDGQYEIVAGERRWRAAAAAQLHEVPVLIREYSDTEVLEVAIIENIQRADLNPIEEAAGYRQLMDKFGHTQEKLAEALGKSRSHIANLLRLLTLPPDVVGLVQKGELSAGHARALITSDDASTLAQKIVRDGLSVRAAEKLAKTVNNPADPKTARPKKEKDADTRALEADLSAALGFPVSIQHGGGSGGQIVIGYKNLEDLDTLCGKLSRG